MALLPIVYMGDDLQRALLLTAYLIMAVDTTCQSTRSHADGPTCAGIGGNRTEPWEGARCQKAKRYRAAKPNDGQWAARCSLDFVPR
jgi:hypothetical protein